MDLGLLHDSKDCIVTDYGRILIHMLDWTTMIVLNDINVFFLTNLRGLLMPAVNNFKQITCFKWPGSFDF